MISSGVGTSPPHLPYHSTGRALDAAFDIFHHLPHAHLDTDHQTAPFFAGRLRMAFSGKGKSVWGRIMATSKPSSFSIVDGGPADPAHGAVADDQAR
jgi:hypothetical protein